MPQPYAHLQRNWHRGSNDEHPMTPAGYYQCQPSPRHRPQVHNKRDYQDYRNDSSRNYCEMCGEENHTTQQCRFRDLVNCHSCQRFGHKMKFCNWYRWNFGHGSHRISWNSEGDDNTLTDSIDCFIHACPLNDYGASRVYIGCVKVDYVGWFSYLLGNNLFWSIFEKRDVPKDGHCFIHALILSLSTLSPDLPCLTYDHVLTLMKI